MRSRGYTGHPDDASNAMYDPVLAGDGRRDSGDAAADAGDGSAVYRPSSARRARPRGGGRNRPASAARRRPGRGGGYGRMGSALDDPDLVAGAVLEGDDDTEAVVLGSDGDGEYKY